MVLPLGGMMMQGPPTEEVLKLMPGLKLAVLGLAVAVVMEFIAGYYPAAMTDLPTVWMGLLLFRDYQRLNRCMLYFTLIAGTNLLYAALFLSTLLSAPVPGAANFFSSDCPPVTIKDHVYTCSWKTQLGDLAVVMAVLFEGMCTVLGYKMFVSTRRAMEENMNGLGGTGNMLIPMYARGGGSGLTAPPFGGAENPLMRAGAGAPGGENEEGRSGNNLLPAPSAPPAGGGFTPFQGQPHRLGDD